MAEATILLLGVALVFVFGWNNSSFLIGNGRGSGAITTGDALLISSVGLVLGMVIEGPKMLSSLSGSLTPSANNQVIVIALLVSLAFTVVLSSVKLPVSFSMVLVGAFVGAVSGSSLPLDYPKLEEVIGFWVVAPLAAALLTFILDKVAVKLVSGMSLITLDTVSRYSVIGTSIAIAFVLGANNIGLIYGTMLNGAGFSDPFAVFLTIVAIAGMVILGRGGVSGTIGDRMLVLSPIGVVATFIASAALIWLGTELAIPISVSQCLLGGMFGAALTKQIKAVNMRLALESVGSWVVAPACAFIVALIIIRP